ncbi:MAG: PTS sugar transporter subunit IIA [Nitrospinota bacterium]
MSIVDYMKPEWITLNLKSKSRHEVFQEMASALGRTGLLNDETIGDLVKKLEERESLSTTGVGEGIAIPHASLKGLKETVIGIGVIPDGVDFSSLDSQPVKVVFMIVGSQSVPRLHIQILARLVRLCRNKDLKEKIMEGTVPEKVLEAIRMVDI